MSEALESEKLKLGKQLFERNNDATFVRSHVIDFESQLPNVTKNACK